MNDLKRLDSTPTLFNNNNNAANMPLGMVEIPKLVDLCARYVAANIPFERVETYGHAMAAATSTDIADDMMSRFGVDSGTIGSSRRDDQNDDRRRFSSSAAAAAFLVPLQQPVPEDLQLKIAAESFPSTIDNIRLYSCLVNGNVDEYLRGEQLYQSGCVRRIIQIGFHLSAEIIPCCPGSSSSNAAAANPTTTNVSSSSRLVLGASSANNYHQVVFCLF